MRILCSCGRTYNWQVVVGGSDRLLALSFLVYMLGRAPANALVDRSIWTIGIPVTAKEAASWARRFKSVLATLGELGPLRELHELNRRNVTRVSIKVRIKDTLWETPAALVFLDQEGIDRQAAALLQTFIESSGNGAPIPVPSQTELVIDLPGSRHRQSRTTDYVLRTCRFFKLPYSFAPEISFSAPSLHTDAGMLKGYYEPRLNAVCGFYRPDGRPMTWFPRGNQPEKRTALLRSDFSAGQTAWKLDGAGRRVEAGALRLSAQAGSNEMTSVAIPCAEVMDFELECEVTVVQLTESSGWSIKYGVRPFECYEVDFYPSRQTMTLRYVRDFVTLDPPLLPMRGSEYVASVGSRTKVVLRCQHGRLSVFLDGRFVNGWNRPSWEWQVPSGQIAICAHPGTDLAVHRLALWRLRPVCEPDPPLTPVPLVDIFRSFGATRARCATFPPGTYVPAFLSGQLLIGRDVAGPLVFVLRSSDESSDAIDFVYFVGQHVRLLRHDRELVQVGEPIFEVATQPSATESGMPGSPPLVTTVDHGGERLEEQVGQIITMRRRNGTWIDSSHWDLHPETGAFLSA